MTKILLINTVKATFFSHLAQNQDTPRKNTKTGAATGRATIDAMPYPEIEKPPARASGQGNTKRGSSCSDEPLHFCQVIPSVKNTTGSTYAVECVERPGGKMRAKYSVNVRTGTVTKN
jgi:hypothetical protein